MTAAAAAAAAAMVVLAASVLRAPGGCVAAAEVEPLLLPVAMVPVAEVWEAATSDSDSTACVRGKVMGKTAACA